MSEAAILKMKAMRAEGKPLWYIARKLFCSEATVWKHTRDMSNPYHTWTEEEVKTLLELRDKKTQFKDIAKILGLTKVSCIKKYYAIRNASKTS